MIRLILLVLIVTQVGCASMRSTPVTRQDDDSFCVQCPANGVPVVVSIPTHLKVTVYEQLYFKIEKDQITLVNKDCHRNLKAMSEQMNTEKVIFVDVKRPAAGTLDYNLEFDSKGQSITQYESFVFDRTLEDSANLLAQLVPGASQQSQSSPDFKMDPDFANTDLPNPDDSKRKHEFVFPQSTPTTTVSYNPNVFTRTRIVAFQIFDINAVDFEEQVQAFLAQHLNSCHDCNTNPGAIVSDDTAPVDNTADQKTSGDKTSDDKTSGDKAPFQDSNNQQSSRQQSGQRIGSQNFSSVSSDPVSLNPVSSNPVQQ